jgi:hypothetical protein
MDSPTIDEQKKLTSLTESELKQKVILDFTYLKSKIDNSVSLSDKEKKSFESLTKKFEKDLENSLGIKISSKEKNAFVELKNSNLDSSLIRLSKFIF